MLSDLVDDDFLSEPFALPPTKTLVSINNIGNSSGPIVLMQPKLEPQSLVFEQQPTKMVPIAPRFDSNQQSSTNPNIHTCSNCTQPIHERYLLYTQDRSSRGNYWHMQCLRCQCCDAALADIASTFYTRDNALLCKSDYMKRYGSRPCSLCSQVIGTNEQIMRISPNHVYHLSCFICVKCHTPLVKGDRYVLFNGQPFCEKDNPLKSTTNTSTPKRGTTSKRGAKAARAQQAFSTPPQYHHTGHITVLNNHHTSSTITHSLLSNNSNGLTSTSDELY